MQTTTRRLNARHSTRPSNFFVHHTPHIPKKPKTHKHEVIAFDTENTNPTHVDRDLESTIGTTITVNGAFDTAGELDSLSNLEFTPTPTAQRHYRQAQLEAAAQILEHARQHDPEAYAQASPHTATDHLTGLYNSATFYAIARNRIAEAQRNGEPVAVFIFDYNTFKEVNDTHGHTAGDAVLREGAHAIKHTLRTCDIVGRIGGDEYMAILPKADAATALLVQERIARAISKHPVNIDGKTLSYRVDTGFSIMNPDTGYDITTHKDRADLAMYARKKTSKHSSVA